MDVSDYDQIYDVGEVDVVEEDEGTSPNYPASGMMNMQNSGDDRKYSLKRPSERFRSMQEECVISLRHWLRGWDEGADGAEEGGSEGHEM